MKRRNYNGIVAMFAAMSAMLIVQPVVAGEQLQLAVTSGDALNFKAPPTVRDVELGVGGVLHGQILDTQGVGVASSPVIVVANGREVARATADSEGRFQASGLRGDTYQVVTAGGAATCRVWAANTSPPGADRQVAVIVSADPVVRAQYGVCGPCGQGGFWSFVSNPWISAALITAAIAVPIAVSNDSGS